MTLKHSDAFHDPKLPGTWLSASPVPAENRFV
jgi:hypothetical protein